MLISPTAIHHLPQLLHAICRHVKLIFGTVITLCALIAMYGSPMVNLRSAGTLLGVEMLVPRADVTIRISEPRKVIEPSEKSSNGIGWDRTE